MCPLHVEFSIGEASPIGLKRRVIWTVGAIQESLVLALQFVVEDDSRHSTALGIDARLLLFERPKHPGVVSQLARLHDTGEERLIGPVAGTRVSLQHRFALGRQRHNPLGTRDVRQGLIGDQPPIGESTQVACRVKVFD